MTDLFEAIKERLENPPSHKRSLRVSSNVKTIDIWNNQLTADEEGEQRAIRMNAVLLSFSTAETRPASLGIKFKVVNVRFYYLLKTLKRDKSPNLDFKRELAQLMEGFVSEGSAEPIFSAFHEVELENDEDHDLIAAPFVDYRTIYTDVSGYWYRSGFEKLNTGTTLDVQPEIVSSL